MATALITKGITRAAKKLTKREIAAFKLGAWTSIPTDYLIEKYVPPAVEKADKAQERAFYRHIDGKPPRRRRKRMPRRRARRRLGPVVVSQDPMEGVVSLKRSLPSMYYARKRARYAHKATSVGSAEKKVHFEEISTSTQAVGTVRSELLYNLSQGAELGQRLGTKIHARYIDVRGYLRNTNASIALTCRLAVIHDKKPQIGGLTVNMWAPESSDNDPVSFSIAGDLAQVSKKFNTNRYRVLSDRKIRLAPAVTASQGKNYTNLNYRVYIDRYISYLTEMTLSDTNKIDPNIHIILFYEHETGTTGTSLTRDIQIYAHFSG